MITIVLQEIDEMIGGTLSDQDEEDVLAELDSIIKEQTKETEPSTTEDQDMGELPEVPSEEPEEHAGNLKLMYFVFFLLCFVPYSFLTVKY